MNPTRQRSYVSGSLPEYKDQSDESQKTEKPKKSLGSILPKIKKSEKKSKSKKTEKSERSKTPEQTDRLHILHFMIPAAVDKYSNIFGSFFLGKEYDDAPADAVENQLHLMNEFKGEDEAKLDHATLRAICLRLSGRAEMLATDTELDKLVLIIKKDVLEAAQRPMGLHLELIKKTEQAMRFIREI